MIFVHDGSELDDQVFADWLEDNGHGDDAAQIRDEVDAGPSECEWCYEYDISVGSVGGVGSVGSVGSVGGGIGGSAGVGSGSVGGGGSGIGGSAGVGSGSVGSVGIDAAESSEQGAEPMSPAPCSLT